MRPVSFHAGGDASDGGVTGTTEVFGTTTDGGGATTDGATTVTAGGTIGGLPTGAIWLIVGLGIALLLVIIALLLVVISCMYCNRRKVKGKC